MCGDPEFKLHSLYQTECVYLNLFSYLFFTMNFRCSLFGDRIFIKPQCNASTPNRMKDTEATQKKGLTSCRVRSITQRAITWIYERVMTIIE